MFSESTAIHSSVMSDEARTIASGTSGHSSLLPSLSFRKSSDIADREARWNVCKFAEILLSEEISSSFRNVEWKLSDYKEFNKMASAVQGCIVQNLAMVCHLNPPKGFTRVSDWHRGSIPNTYDDPPEFKVSALVRGVVTVVSAAEQVSSAVSSVMRTAMMSTGELRTLAKGRGRRRRSMDVNSKRGSLSGDGSVGTDAGANVFTDRIIQFLAEALVCSSDRVSLKDCELSYNGRIGWRAIARALRRKNCTFISPSVFISPKPVLIRYLELPKNELDCGDAVYLAEIFICQPLLILVDLSFNRIGARGMSRMCR